ncbi:MAG: galactose oxidase-like domain-containing protein [Thermoanaerobaculia bacterium]
MLDRALLAVILSAASVGSIGASAAEPSAPGVAEAATGEWGPVIPFPVLPIHAHLLPDGRVLFWDRHDTPEEDGHPRTWDPESGLFTLDAEPVKGHDLFCSGHAFLEDGSLLAAGGHFGFELGQPYAATYEPASAHWSAAPAMNAGRWYPSVLTLADGSALVLSGTDEIAVPNPLPQIFEPASRTWRDLAGATLALPFYPMAFLAPQGDVVVAGPEATARRLTTTGPGVWSDLASALNGGRRAGSAVLYGPGRILVAGGGATPKASAEIIDVAAESPAFREVGSMAHARRHLDLTLLPDGSVLAIGGTSLPENDARGAVLATELWSPRSETWTTLAPMSVPRLYHSIALLLPDGRVLAAGGGHPSDVEHGDPDHFDGQIFSPPYLFRGARPTIVAAPASVALGEAFVVEAGPESVSERVTWVRLGSVTHSFNMNQRFLELDSTATANGRRVVAPSATRLAPPGHYLMFLLDGKGVPSRGRVVQLRGGIFSDGFERGSFAAWTNP